MSQQSPECQEEAEYWGRIEAEGEQQAQYEQEQSYLASQQAEEANKIDGLKTLKNIPKVYKQSDEATYDSDLRQEAIKRVNYLKEQKFKITNVELLDTIKAIEFNRLDAKIEENMWFFNLEEHPDAEDLAGVSKAELTMEYDK